MSGLGRQIKGRRIMFEMTFMGTIAEGLVPGEPASADADNLPAAQAIRCTIPVYEFEIPFQSD
jgi:hypothetical protein